MGNISRRELLKNFGTLGTMVAVGGSVQGVFQPSARAAAAMTEEQKWKQFAGTKLVFMSEDTPPTGAVREHLNVFKEKTGIEVAIRQDTLETVREKVGLDLKGKGTAYALLYAQDKPINMLYHKYYADLNKFMKDPTLPQDPEGYGEDTWLYRFLDVTGRQITKKRTTAFPYDLACAIMMYRVDLFEKYSKDFEKDMGKPLKYDDTTTWKDILDIATWWKKAYAKKLITECPFAIGEQAGEGWTGQLAFQRFTYSHGQWLDWDNFDDFLGSEKPGPSKWGDEQSIFSMKKYKEIMDVSHPDSLIMNWSSLNTAYITGKVAMQIQYGEFAAAVEDPKISVAAEGRTGYALNPLGASEWILDKKKKAVHGTNYGVGGIAINGNLPEKLQKAAWLFCVWVTSKPVQMMVLEKVGGTPTRKSVVEDPKIKAEMNRKAGEKIPKMPNALTYPPILKGIVPPNVVAGPKIPKFNEYDRIITTEMHKAASGKISAEEACKNLKRRIDALHGIKA